MIAQESPRFERKASVDRPDYRAVVSLVHQHPALFREIHQERRINSIYFDTAAYTSAFDKADGILSRRKVRIRWYGELAGIIEKPMLEIKQKENTIVRKKRFPIRPFVFRMNGEEAAIPCVSEHPEDVLHPLEATTSLNPVLLASYRRRYFRTADRRFRLTIDHDMRFYHRGLDSCRWIPGPDRYPVTVIELKYPQDDDNDAREITGWFPFRWGSFSKYLAGLQPVL